MNYYPDTQRDAYHDLKNISEKQGAVLECIKSDPHGMTLFEIEKKLGWPVNRISGRLTELKEKELIRDTNHRRKNPESGKPGIVWEARETGEQRLLFKEV